MVTVVKLLAAHQDFKKVLYGYALYTLFMMGSIVDRNFLHAPAQLEASIIVWLVKHLLFHQIFENCVNLSSNTNTRIYLSFEGIGE